MHNAPAMLISNRLKLLNILETGILISVVCLPPSSAEFGAEGLRKMYSQTVLFCLCVCSACVWVTVTGEAPQLTPTHGAATSTTSTPPPAASDGPLATSPSGTFRGSWMTSRRGRRFQAYRGIYYAEAPVGELRFQPPKPILHYQGVVNASEEGPACPLIAPAGYYVSENCLTINVFTPDNKKKEPLPVILFIHPGGFYAFSGRSDVFGPHYLMDRDVVFVTINYRLSSLGWISTGDKLAPGNNGMKDQVVALRWIQRNIAAFGGDPHLVTITGYSAGSISVMLHMISPMTKGLFHRAISMSASPVGKEPTPTHQYNLAVKQAQLLNCPFDNSTVIMNCLKTKTWQELGDWRGFYEFGFDPTAIWSPVVEPDFGQERFLTLQPLDAIRQRKMHDIPYIISQTEDEFFWQAFSILNNETLLDTMNKEWNRVAPISFALPRQSSTGPANRLRQFYLDNKELKNDTESATALGKLYGDSVVGFGVHRLANLMCRHSSSPVWYYEFSYIGQHSYYEDPVTGKPTGAAHHDDTIYLFSQAYRFPAIAVEGSDARLVDQMTAIFYNFARNGDPNPKGDTPELGPLHWPAMEPNKRRFLRIGDQLTIHENMKEDRMCVWEELYPIQY